MTDDGKAKQYAIGRTYPRFESDYIANFVLCEVEGAYLAGLKADVHTDNSKVIAELENEVLRLTNENKILTNENKILKQGKTNVFAELNDETAKSNEMLMDKVAELEAQIEQLKQNKKTIVHLGNCLEEKKNEQLTKAKDLLKWFV